MAKKKKLTEEDNDLLADLGIEVVAKKTAKHTALEQRIITGFEEIQKFVKEQGRLPGYGEDKDIFERIYAVRLEQILKLEESKKLLKDLDYQNILSEDRKSVMSELEDLDDDELLAQLGVEEHEENSITNLKHVKSRAETRVVNEVANRTRCENFDEFKPLFEEVNEDIASGYRETVRFKKDAGFTKTSLKEKQFIIVGGQTAYIAKIGKTFKAPNGEDDARLRVVYSNGTESNILLRSLIRAMYKDETSRFVSDTSDAKLGPLFSGENSADDQESGTIYVLRSLSNHPMVQENQNVVHKIGVTGGDVKKRVANAINGPTFLMAEVEIIATYKLANINRTKLEKVIHKFFGATKLDIEIIDRFGKPVKAREWFLVPLFIIDQVVDKIKDGTISDYYYDSASAELKRR